MADESGKAPDFDDSAGVPVPRSSRRAALSTYKSWHREPSLYREIYARTVSGLTVVLVVYVVAAMSGVVSRKPLVTLAVLAIAGLVVSSVVMTISSRRLIANWKRLLEAFKPDEEGKREEFEALVRWEVGRFWVYLVFSLGGSAYLIYKLVQWVSDSI